MGFDVYGKNPVVAKGTKEPKHPENYGEMTSEEWRDYSNKRDEYLSKNPGTYFRASIWSWGPIYRIICSECSNLLDEETLEGLAVNDGCGPDDQETCTKMAERIEDFVRCSDLFDEFNGGRYELDSSLRVKKDGTFLSSDADEELFNESRSAYGVEVEHILEFCTFLRNCGGFRAC